MTGAPPSTVEAATAARREPTPPRTQAPHAAARPPLDRCRLAGELVARALAREIH